MGARSKSRAPRRRATRINALRGDAAADASAAPSSGAQSVPLPVYLGLLVCLAGYFAHLLVYAFQCDDAFISFRYARNLADGHGLVFNPGLERVEGYTNFLWVLILAGFCRLGMAPPQAADVLSVALSIALFAMVVRYCLTNRPPGVHAAWAIVPAALLAANRSFAVWSTGGLETRLFELLVVAGVLCTMREMKQARAGSLRALPISALLFAGACLTRPDGLLIAGCVGAARVVIQWRDRSLAARQVAIGLALFVPPVAAHFLFRRAYYGDWLPNTYYAKAAGQVWWSKGAEYFAALILEYAVWLWIPIFIAAIVGLRRRGASATLIVIGAAIVPHAVYVLSLGGDHFEYRPVDLYIPLLAVFVFFGVVQLAANGRARGIISGIYAAMVVAASAAIPTLSHLDHPRDYRPGFPGMMPRDDTTTDLVDPRRHPALFRTPIVGSYLRLYNETIRELSRNFVALRQEEHKAFLACVTRQGRWLAELKDAGMLPPDTHVAVKCVGAIPYYGDLPTLDRLGLTDRQVARMNVSERRRRLMAHSKYAAPEHGQQRGVELWATDGVHLILPSGHPHLLYYGFLSQVGLAHPFVADVGDRRYLLADPLCGKEVLAARFPRLNFVPAGEIFRDELETTNESSMPVPRGEQLDAPYDMLYASCGKKLFDKKYFIAAKAFFERAARYNPQNAGALRAIADLSGDSVVRATQE